MPFLDKFKEKLHFSMILGKTFLSIRTFRLWDDLGVRVEVCKWKISITKTYQTSIFSSIFTYKNVGRSFSNHIFNWGNTPKHSTLLVNHLNLEILWIGLHGFGAKLPKFGAGGTISDFC